MAAAPLTLEDPVSLSEPDLQQSLQDDEAIGPIYQALRIGTRPNPSDLKRKGRECAELAQQWDQLLKDDVLYRQFKDTTGNHHLQAVIPKVSRSDILHQLHDRALGGHPGEVKTLSRLRERFYWLGHADVE